MRLSAALVGISCCLSNAAVAAEPAHGDQAVIHFDGRTFVLAYEGEKDGEVIQEFIPRGQTLENWTELTAIRAYQQFNDPLAFANGMLAEVEKKDADAPTVLMSNKETGGAVLAFIVWPEDRSFVEFNIFRFEKRDGGGLVSQQFAQRVYGDASRTYIADRGAERERLTTLMLTEGLLVQPTPVDGTASQPDPPAQP